jgi:hypothetical protein
LLPLALTIFLSPLSMTQLKLAVILRPLYFYDSQMTLYDMYTTFTFLTSSSKCIK